MENEDLLVILHKIPHYSPPPQFILPGILITSMLVHIRVDVLLPLDIKSQSKNEKLIWISPVVSWRMLLGLYVKKHWERWFIWSLRNWLFNINLKWKPLARSVAMVWKLKFQ